MKNKKIKLYVLLTFCSILTVIWAGVIWVLWNPGAIPSFAAKHEIEDISFQFAIYGNKQKPLANPLGVGVSRNGYVYVTDAGNHQVQVFYPNGRWAFSFGGPGNKEGKFNYPVGITIADNKVFVSEINNHRIQVFNLDGNYLETFSGNNKNKLAAPTAIASDRENRIFAVDKASQSIKVFDSAGTFLQEIGGNDKSFTLRFPMGIAPVADKLVIADSGNSRLIIVDQDGKIIKETKKEDLSLPRGLAAVDLDNIFAVDTFAHRLVLLNKDLVIQKSFGVVGEENEQFYYPDGLAFYRDNLYIVDKGNNRVLVYEVNYK